MPYFIFVLVFCIVLGLGKALDLKLPASTVVLPLVGYFWFSQDALALLSSVPGDERASADALIIGLGLFITGNVIDILLEGDSIS